MICFSLFFSIFLSVCAHFDVQCFDLYSCLDFSARLDCDFSACLDFDFSACLDFSVCFEFSAMSIKLSELILCIVFATKAPDLPWRPWGHFHINLYGMCRFSGYHFSA